MDYALALMALAVLALFSVAVFVLAANTAKGVDILGEVRDMLRVAIDGEPLVVGTKPFDRAQAIESAKRVAAKATPPVDPSFGKLRHVEVTPSSEDTPLSPLTPEDRAALHRERQAWTNDPDYRPAVAVAPYQRVDEDGLLVVTPMRPGPDAAPLALPELSEQGWTPPKSGTLTREGR